MFDTKNINWALVGAVLAALGYLAYKSGGLNMRMFSKLSKNGTVAAVLAIVAYFGIDYVMNRVAVEPLPQGPGLSPDSLPPARVDGYVEPRGQQSGVMGPGGHLMSPALGC